MGHGHQRSLQLARSYFLDLFNFDYDSNIDNILCLIPRCITSNMNLDLIKPVEDKEISWAFYQMDLRKSSRSDGLSWMFFQENWSMVDKDVLGYYKELLNGGRSVREINDTILVLIPKDPQPQSMTSYHPISLCRVIYKLVAKLWVNHLKVLFS